ncbi:hypothetical protein ABPG73_017899 [Tetrahymena malaccensis]
MIKINIIFKVFAIETQAIQGYETKQEQQCACSYMDQMFLEQFNTFKQQLLIDENTKCVDQIRITIKQEEKETLQAHIQCINQFLVTIKRLLPNIRDLKLNIEADYQWNDIHFQQLLEQVQSLEVNDIYSYLPLSNFKYPTLKRVFINPEPYQQIMNQQLVQGKDDFAIQTELEESFLQFLSCINLQQIDFIQIDGHQFPELIKILLDALFNTDKSNIKRLELNLSVDSQQFHIIFSLSNICKIFPSCQVSLNYIIDFSPLLSSKKRIYESLDKQSNDKCNNQFDKSDLNAFQLMNDFPYLLKEIFKNFDNNSIKLVFKNLKSLDQLELFDRIKNNHQNSQDCSCFNNLISKNFKADNKIDENNKIFAEMTSLIHDKINKLHQYDEDFNCLPSNNDQSYVQEQNENKKNSFMINLNNPFLTLYAQIQSQNYQKFKNSTDEDKNEKKRKLIQQNQENNLKNESPQQQQQQQINYTYPFQPLSLFKAKQCFSNQKNDSNIQKNEQQSKQIVQQQADQTNQILSKYFLPYQTNEIITLELILENTVFGNNYKELFDFISKCIHLKRLTLLNFCLQDNFGSQQSIPQQIGQRQKTDTQQAMHVYSSVFSLQPRRSIEKAGGKFRTEQKIKNNCLEQKSREGVILCFANDQKTDGTKVCDNCISDVKQIQINKTKLQISRNLQNLLDTEVIRLFDADGAKYEKLYSELCLSEVFTVKVNLKKSILEDFELLIQQLICLKELEITEDQEEQFDAETFQVLCQILQKLNLVSNVDLPIFQNQDIQKVQFERMIVNHIEEMPLTKFQINLKSNRILRDNSLIELSQVLSRHTQLEDFAINLENNTAIAQQGLTEVANILKNQKKIQSVDINFLNNLSFQDQQLIDLAEALHKKNDIKFLSLNFHKNDNFSDNSLQKLADSLAEFTKIEKLKLDFHYNTIFTDKAFYSLTSSMNRMKGLQEIFLNFCKNNTLTDESLANLSRVLITKQKITNLYLNFNYNEQFQSQSFTDLGVSIGQMSGLKYLSLEFERSKHFDDQSIVDMITGIKRQVNLKQIQFNLRQNNNLSQTSLREMVPCFQSMKKLKDFTLYINNGYYKDVKDFLSRYPSDENKEEGEGEDAS